MIPMQSESERALKGSTDLDKRIVQPCEYNEVANDDLILSINVLSSVGHVACGLVQNANCPEIPEGNGKLAWDRLVIKYAVHTAPYLLKFYNEFYNSKLDSAEKDLDERISYFEELKIVSQMKIFRSMFSIICLRSMM